MKKAAISLLVSLASTVAMAQSSEVTNAILSMKDGALGEAKKSIENASAHEKTKDEPKTWYYKGMVYESIASNPIFGKENPDAAKIAFESFEKAKKLDETATKPGKFKKNIEEAWNSPSFAFAIQNAGVAAYQNKNYKDSYDYFTMYQAVKPLDTLGYVYAAQMALADNNYKNAKDTYVRSLEKTGYVTLEILSNMIYIYKSVESEKDMDKALEMAKMGKSKYPNNQNFANQEIDILKSTGKINEAVAEQEAIVQKNPENADQQLMLGSLYEQVNQSEKAQETYKKVLALNPKSFEANFNLGAIYYNQAAKILAETRNMGIAEYNKKGKAQEASAKDILRKALPYFENAHQSKPEDESAKKTLIDVYTNIGEKEKAANIK